MKGKKQVESSKPPRIKTQGIIPRVFITPEDWWKIEQIVDKCDKEVLWWMKVEEIAEGCYQISDPYVSYQRVSGSQCEADDAKQFPEYEKYWLPQLEALGEVTDEAYNQEQSARTSCWAHSHVNMAVSPSGQDNAQFKQYYETYMSAWGNQGGKIPQMMLIVNKKGMYSLEVYMPDRKIHHEGITLELLKDFSWPELDSILKERVKSEEPKHTTYAFGGPSGWNPRSRQEWDAKKNSLTTTIQQQNISSTNSTGENKGEPEDLLHFGKRTLSSKLTEGVRRQAKALLTPYNFCKGTDIQKLPLTLSRAIEHNARNPALSMMVYEAYTYPKDIEVEYRASGPLSLIKEATRKPNKHEHSVAIVEFITKLNRMIKQSLDCLDEEVVFLAACMNLVHVISLLMNNTSLETKEIDKAFANWQAAYAAYIDGKLFENSTEEGDCYLHS